MSGIFQQLPGIFIRQSYAGVDNPRYVDDIVAANDLVTTALGVLAGLGPNDFAILQGLAYDQGTNTYSPGYYYLNGQVYNQTATFAAGLYLAPLLQDAIQKPFPDGTPRYIYQLFLSQATNVADGSTPIFNGNMNANRVDSKTIAAAILTIQQRLSQLGGASNLNVGTTPGTVAAGDDARFGYSRADIDTLFAKKTVVLLTDHSSPLFTPTQPQDPATKAYVDSLGSAQKLAGGHVQVGDIGGGGLTITISLGVTLNNTSYIPILTTTSGKVSNPYDDTPVGFATKNKTIISFDVVMFENRGVTENIGIDWICLAF